MMWLKFYKNYTVALWTMNFREDQQWNQLGGLLQSPEQEMVLACQIPQEVIVQIVRRGPFYSFLGLNSLESHKQPFFFSCSLVIFLIRGNKPKMCETQVEVGAGKGGNHQMENQHLNMICLVQLCSMKAVTACCVLYCFSSTWYMVDIQKIFAK